MIKQFCWLTLTLFILSGCGSQGSTGGYQVYQGPTAVLPTSAPSEPPTPTATSVIDHLFTPTPVPTATSLPDEVLGLVVDVVDTQTLIVVLQGDSADERYTVRLLGVNAPPSDADNPWGVVARQSVQAWLAGNVVRLVVDNSLQVEERTLPRYVYRGQEMINLRLIAEGLAVPEFSAPDTLFQTEFEAAAQIARSNRTGLWGPDPTPTPTIISTNTQTVTITTSPTAIPIETSTSTPTLTVTAVVTATVVATATIESQP